MPEYISPEIEQDPAAIQQQMIDDLETALPGLEVKPATVIYYLIAIFAFLWARLAEQSSQVFSTIFRYYGRRIVRIPPNDAVSATTTVTFSADDADGPYDIPAGTEVNLRAADGSLAAFRTLELVTIPNGDTVTGPVTVAAATPGAAANDLSTYVDVTQTFSWLDTVTVLAPTSGGEDAEDDDAYQNRLADALSLLANTLVIPVDFEVYARTQPGIDRALAIDNYTPGPPADDAAPGHITVFPIDATGGPLVPDEKDALLAELQALTETNLIPHVADPTYTTVEIEYLGVAEAGQDLDLVEVTVNAAILALISPVTWALPTQGDVRGWENRTIVRYQDVSRVINSVEGFDYHTTLTINGVAGDLVLGGPAPLPDPASTASGTVTTP